MTFAARVFLLLMLSMVFHHAAAQRINVGLTFQYLILKQVAVDSDIIEGRHSYSQYRVVDNRWKFFSAGQSIVIGSVLQLDYKKFYAVIEPSFELNTYNYTVQYPVSPSYDENITFQTLFLQTELPVYLGYQFGASSLIRYSVFAGGIAVMPYMLEHDFQSKDLDNPEYEYFNSSDLHEVLYNTRPYFNLLAGFSLHFASLGKIDIRYHRRLGNPGDLYPVTFNSLGMGLTYYLPMNLRKKKIYYEE